ncbi:glycosyltransferase family 4 protein [Methylomonas sp. LWB]|uniref:glycosyltransferase family 4 protein n=1 Tax=Methylomonas sp. LWB TaxID=1905845 RepID=UPI001115224B|nr:glycosyltransferase family 4 protein [Methylomonas sp. LWB]
MPTPPAMLNIRHFANTIVGKPGNIGVRTERIIRALSAQGDSGYCLSRQAQLKSPGFVYRDMGWLGHLPRLLNAARIYLAPGFNHRYPDVKLFEWFAARHWQEASAGPRPIAHVWDACPRLLTALKTAGIPVLLDMPVAPTAYSLRIAEQYDLDFLMTHRSMLDFEQAACELADLIAAPSRFVAEELQRIGVTPDKIRIAEFGVDPPSGPTKPRPPKKPGAALDFCFAGNINRRKGVDLLLDAWRDPAFAGDNLHLCGRLYPEIDVAAATNPVLTPGFVNTFEYLPNCDVFVFPSWLEGSAKAVFEAMACGLPAIVSDASGSVVRDGIDGFVIAAGDRDALRERMLWFKTHPEQIRAMGDNARARARQFSWDGYAAKVVEMYRELADRAHACVAPIDKAAR